MRENRETKSHSHSSPQPLASPVQVPWKKYSSLSLQEQDNGEDERLEGHTTDEEEEDLKEQMHEDEQEVYADLPQEDAREDVSMPNAAAGSAENHASASSTAEAAADAAQAAAAARVAQPGLIVYV